MKITREEFQKWLDQPTFNSNSPFNWMDMNTQGLEKISDNDLLGRMSYVVHPTYPGFGVIAELCKRFNRSK